MHRFIQQCFLLLSHMIVRSKSNAGDNVILFDILLLLSTRDNEKIIVIFSNAQCITRCYAHRSAARENVTFEYNRYGLESCAPQKGLQDGAFPSPRT